MSTTTREDKGGQVAKRRQAPMSVKRFQDVLRQVGLGEDEDWANASQGDFERAIDEALLEVCFAQQIASIEPFDQRIYSHRSLHIAIAHSTLRRSASSSVK